MDHDESGHSEIHSALFSSWKIAFGVGFERDHSSSDDSEAARSRTSSPRQRTAFQKCSSGPLTKLWESSSTESSPMKKPIQPESQKSQVSLECTKSSTELECFTLDVILKEGHDLVIRDTCGTSDPYVKFKVGDKQYYRSQTVFRNLNPKWNEKFSIPIQNLTEIVKIKVMDYDRGLVRDDPMGEAAFEPNQLELNKPTDLKLYLTDKKKSKMPSDSAYMGYIVLQCTLVPQTGSQLQKYLRSINAQSSIEKIKKKTPVRNAVVTIVLIEGKDLVAMDDNGLSDPYVRFQIGKERYKSKTKPKTLNPEWLEQFDMYLFDSSDSQILEIIVYDRDVGGSDDIMGRASIDISQMEIEKTHLIKQDLIDGAGQIVMMLTVTGIPVKQLWCELNTSKKIEMVSKYGILQSFNDVGDVGWLHVKVMRAKGLAAADFGGKSDPFCVLELMNERLQTHTEYNTLTPEWHKNFTFNVKDIHSWLEVIVYDEDRDKKVDFLGYVAIPLLLIKNGERQWYILKDRKPGRPSKGAIELEMYLVYNYFKAALKTFSPKEKKLTNPTPRFRVATMKHNINRMGKVVRAILELSRFIQSCFDWESKLRSCLTFVIFTVSVLTFKMYMLPLTLLIMLLKNLFVLQLVKKFTKNKEEEEEADEEEDDDDDEKESKSRTKSTSLREKLQSIQDVCLQLQETMDTLASFNEQLKHIFIWTVPWLSMLTICILGTAVVILYYIPLEYVLVLWGINKFTKKLRNPKTKTNNELLDFLSRAPSDKDLHLYDSTENIDKST